MFIRRLGLPEGELLIVDECFNIFANLSYYILL